MRNRAKPYLLAALPAVPYLIGVGLQVSGVTNIPLSVAVFEVAAILATGVAWALWADWRATAVIVPRKRTIQDSIRRWDGLSIPRLGTIRTEIVAAVLVLLASNAAILGFIGLAEQRAQTATASLQKSAHAEKLTQFYADLSGLFFQQLPKDMSNDDFALWEKHVVEKQDEIMKWVYYNMGPTGQARLLDLEGGEMRKWPSAINEKQNLIMNQIFHFQKNLRAMIETTVWDRHDEAKSK